MLTSDFDYHLPPDRIAQAPSSRGSSRLLVLRRADGSLEDHTVADLPGLLDAGDLLLLNDTRVIPARLWARRPTGRRFELLLLRACDDRRWESLVRPSARVRRGEPLVLTDGGSVTPVEPLGEGQWVLDCCPPLDLDRLERLGEPPLPPYIERPAGARPTDREDYQTVYARAPGAVAAPTAGLHFTPELLEELRRAAVELAFLTLHVGLGTFRPVAVEAVHEHRMHSEWFEVGEATATAVNRARAAGRRVVCVGTTSVRALEAALAAGGGTVRPGAGSTELFIVPGYSFRGVGAMLTNFHLPRSTLIMMVSAFAGRERVLAAYAEAIARGYRFYSYGDAMLIL